MWFCYEKSVTTGWKPVVYHNVKPGNEITKINRSTIYDVPAECIGGDGEPMFGKLVEMFPPPPKTVNVKIEI